MTWRQLAITLVALAIPTSAIAQPTAARSCPGAAVELNAVPSPYHIYVGSDAATYRICTVKNQGSKFRIHVDGVYHDHDATGAGKCLDVQGKSLTAVAVQGDLKFFYCQLPR